MSIDPEAVGPATGEGRGPLEGAVRRFVDAWRQGLRPAIDDYLDADGSRHSLLVELVRADLELRLKAGEAARVEGYLSRYPELADDRSAVLGLIAAEHEFRRRGEPGLSLDDYRQRFPQYRGELSERAAAATVPGRDTPPQADPRHEAPPEVAGYEVLSLLGRGGMGVVFRALQKSLHRLVALKVLPAACAHDPLWLERFRREALAASALNHPHVCTIYDTGQSAGRPFLSMELVEGRTLEGLAGERRPVEESVRLVRQAARALAAAHAAGVVHRDVKPANLMVRGDGILKVLDFGLARRLPTEETPDPSSGGKATDPGTLLGTPLYMSPEQTRAEPVGPATDVFSLGLVLYELTTGLHPFQADTSVGVMHAIAAQAPVAPARLNPEVPAALDALIRRMLAKDPGLRPTAAEVDAALAKVGEARAAPAAPPPGSGKPPAVGRGGERAALRAGFESAAAGRGQVLCVTGEAGLGKTTLVEDFLAGLNAGGEPCRVARGRCSERLSGAEAYLPILEALDSLARGEAGETAARALRLVAPAWYAEVAPAAAVPLAAPAQGSSQQRMKRELFAFLEVVSRSRPLVLFLDDVHWADASTADLLGYIGSRCAGLYLLLVVTYRPSDLRRSDHPFGPVQLELQRHGVCREVPLGFLSHGEVRSYLELAFPGHRFGAEFEGLIHANTEGNPLFLVDLLRHLRDRGVIAAAPGGWALARDVPDFQRELPASVSSLIQRKLAQLDGADRLLLSVASVQGYEFDSSVVARAADRDAIDVEERLASLDRVQGLVRLRGEHEFPDGTHAVRYQFVHVLYQNALYAALQPSRRARSSLRVAEALLECHGGKSAAVAGELGLLFEAARDWARAADHLLAAARNAARVFAHREAADLSRRGLRLLDGLPETPRRDALELPLRMMLGLQLQVTQGYAAPEGARAYGRARDLCRRLGAGEETLFSVLWGLWLEAKVSSDLPRARALAGELQALARRVNAPDLELQAQQAMAVTTLCLGDPSATMQHVEQAALLYEPARHRAHLHQFGHDPGVARKAFGAVALWLLGHADAAARLSDEAVGLSRELSQPNSQALALHFAAVVHQLRRDAPRARACAEGCAALSAEHGLSFWLAGSAVMSGWALAAGGSAEGVGRLRRGLHDWQATGSGTYRTYYLGLLAEALAGCGRAEEAGQVLDEALALARVTAEGLYEAELRRLRGELMPAEGSEAEFRAALALARRQGARSFELRAALSLSRLLQRLDRAAEVQPLLTESCRTFPAGSAAELREAQELLDRLAP